MLKTAIERKPRLLRHKSQWFLFLLCLLNMSVFCQLLPVIHNPVVEEEGFTIIIQAWSRYDALSSILLNFEDCLKSGVPLRSIHVLRPANGGPDSWYEGSIPIFWDKVSVDSPLFDDIQRRFLFPFEGINTKAVLHIDDDIIPECSGLMNGFQIWKLHPNQIVGFVPRLAYREADRYYYKKWISGVWRHHKYNIVLTKYAFLNIKYMELYNTNVPQQVQDFVREHTNCEDISMQYLISSLIDKPPIFVAGDFMDVGPFHGISTGLETNSGKHFDIRDECIKLMSEVYGSQTTWGIPLSESKVFYAGRWSLWVKLFGWFPNSRFEYFAW